jgi:hypothetical protein
VEKKEQGKGTLLTWNNQGQHGMSIDMPGHRRLSVHPLMVATSPMETWPLLLVRENEMGRECILLTSTTTTLSPSGQCDMPGCHRLSLFGASQMMDVVVGGGGGGGGGGGYAVEVGCRCRRWWLRRKRVIC